MIGKLLRAVWRGGTAALLWGLVGACLARLLMRGIAEVTGTPTSFTLLGTAMIAVFFVGLMVPGAIALAWSPDRWPWLVLAAGVVLLVIEAVGIGLSDLSATVHLTTGRWVLLGVLLVALAGVVAGQALLIGRTARRSAVSLIAA